MCNTHTDMEELEVRPRLLLPGFYSQKRMAGERHASAYHAPWLDMQRVDDDDKFTPTKHPTPPPHHSNRPAAAHTDTETPLQ